MQVSERFDGLDGYFINQLEILKRFIVIDSNFLEVYPKTTVNDSTL